MRENDVFILSLCIISTYLLGLSQSDECQISM